MNVNDVLIDGYSRISQILNRSLPGLTAEQLIYRPAEEANSIAWLAWHLTRIQDKHLSDLAARPQEWITGGWHTKFEKPAEPADTGQRYTSEQVATIKPTDPQLLLDYHDAVFQRSVAFIKPLTPEDLDREINEPQYDPLPTVGVRLVSVIVDNIQHAGQVAYLRGLIEARRWYPA
ncbi:MAG: mycothiol transferase [Chloroflexota bacterium]